MFIAKLRVREAATCVGRSLFQFSARTSTILTDAGSDIFTTETMNTPCILVVNDILGDPAAFVSW